MNLEQPALGVVSTLLVSALSLAFVSAFDFPTFAGWISFYLTCAVTVLVMMLALWRTEHPRFAAAHAQPLKGILTTLVALVGGAVVCVLFFMTVGGGISPPAPMLIEFTIASVVMTFWVCIAWGGWPSNVLVRGSVAAGVLQLFAGYLVNFLLFRTLFNYGFMQGAPVYVASLDPQGMLNAAQLLPLYVTVLSGLFLVLCFDVWPLTTNPSLMKQPVLGVVWTLVILAIGGALFYTGTVIVGMDPMIFLVTVPIPFLFGTVVVLNMCENALFARLPQPAKGVLNVLAAIGFGGGLSLVFWTLMAVVSGALPSGPPTYAAQLWLASALLSVTFPSLVVHAAFFDFWPLRKAKVAVSEARPEPS